MTSQVKSIVNVNIGSGKQAPKLSVIDVAMANSAAFSSIGTKTDGSKEEIDYAQ